MTSNHQKNIPPKKTDSEPSKATESKSAKAPGTASPKEADARSSAKPHRRRAYLDDFKKTQNGDYQYEGSRYACELSEKEWKKKSTGMAAAGIAVLRSPQAAYRRWDCREVFSCCFHMQCSWRQPAASRGHVQGFGARNIRFGNTFISRQCAKYRCAAESALRQPECPS